MEILLDLDGVLANFVQVALHAHGAMQQWPEGVKSLQQLLNLTNDELFARLPFNLYDFMPEMHDARQIIQIVERFDSEFHICSAMRCPKNHLPHLVFGKTKWIQRKFDLSSERIALIDNKSRLARHTNVVLIDDDESNVQSFIAHGGKAILYPRPWNCNHWHTKPLESLYEELANV